MGLQKPLLDPISDTKPGKNNLITDVPGVRVGQQTIITDRLKTGVTTILPTTENIFENKLAAAGLVINGFGKSTGLIQVEELGTLETPIVLTNTLSVGVAYNYLVKKALAENPQIGLETGTVNPLVMECNDGAVNNIRDLGVTEADIEAAFANCSEQFEEGCFGGGTGMCCYDLKGGIGSASRQIEIDGQTFTLGVLVMSNYGYVSDLNIYDQPIGQQISQLDEYHKRDEDGSIITIIATDIPFNSRQLKRIAKRSSVGITRTGSFIGNDSGEITLAFSTANQIKHEPKHQLMTHQAISDDQMDRYFRMTVSAVEEAIISSLVHATTTIDRKGQQRLSLTDALKKVANKDSAAAPQIAKLQAQLGLETSFA
ncbi:aminopeptidase [Ligilactobacillus pabuli]|uniref:Aminopeptidase n=1 Tax=Ligilactobacillus pabuli TaxID=2886039 RepID=A0ABQ5JJG6_9LACO|nr:P1 family peptidase [Ligilactobacillus pabuli]GKS81998.1 aminopeptidase [Ligilactobacillus pabuli]HIW89742.1 P1 family peptidase [Candidatus Ligilactobacillus excrementipullorum]